MVQVSRVPGRQVFKFFQIQSSKVAGDEVSVRFRFLDSTKTSAPLRDLAATAAGKKEIQRKSLSCLHLGSGKVASKSNPEDFQDQNLAGTLTKARNN